ncbi:unnamed protein product [Calypogeia fissa]
MNHGIILLSKTQTPLAPILRVRLGLRTVVSTDCLRGLSKGLKLDVPVGKRQQPHAVMLAVNLARLQTSKQETFSHQSAWSAGLVFTNGP